MAKRVLILLILTTAAATDAEILLNNVRSGQALGLAPPKTLINLNEETKDIINIVKYLEESGLLISSENNFK